MSVFWGYFYDKDGRFTVMESLKTKAVFQKFIRYETNNEDVVTPEKLCTLHQSVEDGTYQPVEGEEVIPKQECDRCVMEKIENIPVTKPVEYEEYVGEEPIVPEYCTLEPVPDLIFEPVFRDGHWVKMRPDLPPQPEPGPSEMDILKEKLSLMETAMGEFIMQQALKGMDN